MGAFPAMRYGRELSAIVGAETRAITSPGHPPRVTTKSDLRRTSHAAALPDHRRPDSGRRLQPGPCIADGATRIGTWLAPARRSSSAPAGDKRRSPTTTTGDAAR